MALLTYRIAGLIVWAIWGAGAPGIVISVL
jgi:hypothetical protein